MLFKKNFQNLPIYLLETNPWVSRLTQFKPMLYRSQLYLVDQKWFSKMEVWNYEVGSVRRLGGTGRQEPDLGGLWRPYQSIYTFILNVGEPLWCVEQESAYKIGKLGQDGNLMGSGMAEYVAFSSWTSVAFLLGLYLFRIRNAVHAEGG